MADVKISALPALSSAALTDLFAVVQGGVTYKGTLTQLVDAFTSTGLTATAGALTVNLSTGVAGGQSVIGGTAASNSLTLSSTSNATKGSILFGTSAYDEVNNWLGIGIASPTVTGQFGTTSNLHSSNNTILLVGKDQNATTNLSISNNTAGTAASVGLLLNSRYRSTVFYDLSTSYTTFSEFSGQTLIEPDNTTNHGLVISIPNNGSTIRFYGGGRASTNRHFTYFSGTGNFLLQSGGTHTDAGFRLDVNGTLRAQGDVTISDTRNIILATGTGTKIGTGTTQKLGFWNATPIVQPTTAVAAATLVGGGGTNLTDTDTFDGYTLQQVVKALRNAGLLA